MLKDLGALVAPTVMAIMFVAVVVSILRSQNNSRRKAREGSLAGKPSPDAGQRQPRSRDGQAAAEAGDGSAPVARPSVDGASGDLPLNAD
jgi:hypothetical protein